MVVNPTELPIGPTSGIGTAMIIVSLLLNVAVLTAVIGSLVAKAEWTASAYGERTPARDILLAIYLAILAASAALLVGVLAVPHGWMLGAVSALLSLQIVYKVLTVVTVSRALRNPVVLSNLGIAAVHAVTLMVLIPLVR
jgi:hypothetical protein